MRSPISIRVGFVIVGALILLLVISDAVVAHRARGAAVPPAVRVVIRSCGLDARSHLVRVSGQVVNGTPDVVASYRFSVAVADIAGDEEDEPVAVGALRAGAAQPFVLDSKSRFPDGRVHCALANLNAPGDL